MSSTLVNAKLVPLKMVRSRKFVDIVEASCVKRRLG